jgi:phosphatidylserine/phosphatidylglycerophosphate/cardiolipin synthase-like enzyme
MQRTVILLSATLLLTAYLPAQNANHVVISEIYGGGGNNGSIWKNDFIELYNPTGSAISLQGWSVRYASATGTSWQQTVLSGVIQPRGFFLIQEAKGNGGVQNLPTPDVVGTIAMAATGGKVALVTDTLSFVNPTDANVVDFVGYGTNASKFEGSGPAPAPGNTTSIERKAFATSTNATLGSSGTEEKAGNGWDSDDNANDLVAQSLASINPQNSASPTEPPSGAFAGTGSADLSPLSIQADTSMTVTFTLRGDASGVITSVRVLVPPPLAWPGSIADVSITVVGTPTLQASRDTLTLRNLGIGQADSLLLQLSRLSAPDTTLKVAFGIETGGGSDSTAPIRVLPELLVYGKPLPIADARANDGRGVPLLLGKLVTIRGIVTVSSQFGGPSYVQDVSGGIAVFDNSFQAAVTLGDEVTLTGTASQYFGLTELQQVTLHHIHSSGNEMSPVVVTAQQIADDGRDGIEQYEGQLVRLNRVVVRDTTGQPITVWEVGGGQAGTNYELSDSTGTVTLRIDKDVDIVRAFAPTGTFDAIGVVGQYKPDTPYVGGYQIQPRGRADIISSGPSISVAPYETNITSASLTLNWETEKPGSSQLRYGETKSYEFGTTGDMSKGLSHAVAISNLTPATAYHVQAFSVDGIDTSFASDRVVSTSSLGSSGQINVYFNKSVDHALARPDAAEGDADFVDRLLMRIAGAQMTIDCALYSISGSVGETIAQALVEAHRRQVKVRMIVEKDNLSHSTGPVMDGIITPAGIPWIADDFDPVNGGVGLHHNKFIVVDARGSADQAWVWTGSWNLTDPGTNDDMQNVIEIQDQALAGAYTLEFNEMWGSASDVPDASDARFGARKLDNTPHIFTINGTRLECYFSPSDRTTSQIINTLNRADHSINLALMTFTRSEIAAALKVRREAGVKVRAVLDNKTDSGSQFNFLQSNGMEVLLDPDPDALLHHKYAVIDAEQIEGQPAQWVITGSHNWTSAAENSNNENTLIIQNDRIANQYLQEFAARYKESGGADNIVLGIERITDQGPKRTSLSQNYPNPFNPRTAVSFQLSAVGRVTLRVFDVLGREVAVLVDEQKEPGSYRVMWEAARLSSGIYFCRLQVGGFVETRKMVLIK